MKQTISSLHKRQGKEGHNHDIVICESNQQYSTFIALNQDSGIFSLLILPKENMGKIAR